MACRDTVSNSSAPATSATAAAVADRFGIQPEVAAVIVDEVTDAIEQGVSPTEVWADLAVDCAHQLSAEVQLEQVIEFVARRQGLTAHLG